MPVRLIQLPSLRSFSFSNLMRQNFEWIIHLQQLGCLSYLPPLTTRIVPNEMLQQENPGVLLSSYNISYLSFLLILYAQNSVFLYSPILHQTADYCWQVIQVECRFLSS